MILLQKTRSSRRAESPSNLKDKQSLCTSAVTVQECDARTTIPLTPTLSPKGARGPEKRRYERDGDARALRIRSPRPPLR